MNREILFRGKQLDTGKWVYGYYMYVGYINVPFTGICGRIDDPVQVDPETVGQYVGYTDNWDNRKFEGDMFECDDERYIIAWDDAKFVAQGVFSNDVLDLGEFYPNDVNVIGNIHDNPELGGER